MNENNSLSLYKLIKQKSQEKGRPLKVICDWDDTIQPLKPAAVYEKIVDPDISYEKFFKDFWENSTFTLSPSKRGMWEGRSKEENQRIEKFLGGSKIKEAIKKFEEEQLSWSRKHPEVKKDKSLRWINYAKSFYGNPRRYKTPLTNIADDLLRAIEEDLIKELIIVSSFNEGDLNAAGKMKKMVETFGQLPIVKVDFAMHERRSDGLANEESLRWNIIKNKYPDFDVLVDDSLKAIAKTKEIFPHKCYLIPFYNQLTEKWKVKYMDSGEGSVYFLDMSIGKIKDEDFAKAAEEYKAKKARQSQPSPEPKKLLTLNYISGSIIGGLLIIGIVAYLLKRRKNKNKRRLKKQMKMEETKV